MPEEELDRDMNALMTALEAKLLLGLSNLQIPPWIHPKADTYIHSAQPKKKKSAFIPHCTWALLRTAFIISYQGKKKKIIR